MDGVCSTHGEIINAYKMLVGMTEVERPLGISKQDWEDNIKMYIRKIEVEDVSWIHLAQDRDRWQAVMDLRVLIKGGIFLE
jgi:hypothetical protein